MMSHPVRLFPRRDSSSRWHPTLGTALAFALILSLHSTHSHAIDTVITFEERFPGEVVTDQYASQGIRFEPTDPGESLVAVEFLPGQRALQVPGWTGIEPDFVAARGSFDRARSRVSVTVKAIDTGTPRVRLRAYSGQGVLLDERMIMAPPGLPLSLAVSGFNWTGQPGDPIIPLIVYFEVDAYRGGRIVIDDVTFDDPSVTESPELALTVPPIGSLTVGASAQVDVRVRRLNGLNLPVTLSWDNATSGVSATFVPNPVPVDTDISRMTVSVASTTALGAFSGTVRGAAGSASDTFLVSGSVEEPFTLRVPSSVDLSACSLNIPVTVYRHPAFTGSVTLSVHGLPDGVTAELDPSALTFPGGAISDSRTLRLSINDGLVARGTTATVTATSTSSPPLVSSQSLVFLERLCSAAPMNLVWDRVDANGFPLNPRWAYEVQTGQRPFPAAIPQCRGYGSLGGKGVNIGQPPCTTQPTYETDLGGGGCNSDGPGHVLWKTVTYETKSLTWAGWSTAADNDYNFTLDLGKDVNNNPYPSIAGLIKQWDGEDQWSLPLEFNYTETVRDFTTDWWTRFRDQVWLDQGADIARAYERWCSTEHYYDACAMVPGVRAIATGLLGIDLGHAGLTESHPVFMLAINTTEDSDHDEWSMFFRNWGNVGFCSNGHVPIGLTAGRQILKITLPWKVGKSAGSLGEATKFFRSGSAHIIWPIQFVPGVGVIVTVEMGDPSEKEIEFGELHLDWYPSDSTRVANGSRRSGTAETMATSVPIISPVAPGQSPHCRELLSGTDSSQLEDTERLFARITDCLPEERRNRVRVFAGELPSEPLRQYTLDADLSVEELRVPPAPPVAPEPGPVVIDRNWAAYQLRLTHALCLLGPQWLRNRSLCEFPVSQSCGNGAVDIGEECDEGNNPGADGCSATCLIESDFDHDQVIDSVDTCVNIESSQSFRGTPKIQVSTDKNGHVNLALNATVQMPSGWSMKQFDPNRADLNILDPAASAAGVRLRVSDALATGFDTVLFGTPSGEGTSGWSRKGSKWFFTGIPGTTSWSGPGTLTMKLAGQNNGRVRVGLKWSDTGIALSPALLPISVTLVLGREGGAAARGECGETKFSLAECKFNKTGTRLACKKTCGNRRLNSTEVCDPPGQPAQCGSGLVCRADCSRCDQPAPTPMLVFVTRGAFSGAEIGGLLGADAKCTEEAQVAGRSGTFRAWLSSSTMSSAERLRHGTGPYVMTDGTKVADDWSDLTDGSLDAAITRGADATDLGLGGVWTATTPSGGISYPANTCSDWTSNSGVGADGYRGATNGDWTRNSVVLLDSCAVRSPLYCFEQPEEDEDR